jgi:hypothetical protein
MVLGFSLDCALGHTGPENEMVAGRLPAAHAYSGSSAIASHWSCSIWICSFQ